LLEAVVAFLDGHSGQSASDVQTAVESVNKFFTVHSFRSVAGTAVKPVASASFYQPEPARSDEQNTSPLSALLAHFISLISLFESNNSGHDGSRKARAKGSDSSSDSSSSDSESDSDADSDSEPPQSADAQVEFFQRTVLLVLIGLSSYELCEVASSLNLAPRGGLTKRSRSLCNTVFRRAVVDVQSQTAARTPVEYLQ
jgi:hypothetical protein